MIRLDHIWVAQPDCLRSSKHVPQHPLNHHSYREPIGETRQNQCVHPTQRTKQRAESLQNSLAMLNWPLGERAVLRIIVAKMRPVVRLRQCPKVYCGFPSNSSPWLQDARSNYMSDELFKRIDEWRRKLLDLTKRNQLVSCKIGPRSAIRLLFQSIAITCSSHEYCRDQDDYKW